ncbi:MAG: hypothetical protein IEMM0002_0273 [bacterium]|nr:MAG: hypothetical protein IEMM0002_0273 [bacterium]
MKKLFNNPMVVGAMVLIALGIVSWNLIGPTIGEKTVHKTVEPTTAVKKKSKENEAAPVLKNEPDRKNVNKKKLGWKWDGKRDPFKTPEAPVIQKKYIAPTMRLRLYAVWVEPGVSYAYINDNIYKEGDRIGAYRVAEIKPDSVLLKGPKGDRFLKF